MGVIEASDRARKVVQMKGEKYAASAWLREIIGRYKDEADGFSRGCSAMTKMFGIDCKEETCRDCMIKMVTAIADRIDAERALPDGMEWPRFEDGELVRIGDELEFEGKTMLVCDATFYADDWALWCDREDMSGRLYGKYGERVKRPTPKVLDADGVPIEVGDTVYCDDDPEPLQVDLIYAGSMGYCTVRLKDSAGTYTSADAPRLSHKKPEPADSWERIASDMEDFAVDNEINGDHEVFDRAMDFVHRIRRLAKKEEA